MTQGRGSQINPEFTEHEAKMKEADFCSVKDTEVTGERRHLKRPRLKLDPHPRHTPLKHEQRKGVAIAEWPSVTLSLSLLEML